MKTGLLAVTLLVFLLHSNSVSAQLHDEDSISYQSALSHTLSVYYNQLGDQSPLYNGSLYTNYKIVFREGSPYFLNDKYQNGSILYDGVLFKDIPLLYDDLRRLIVTKNQAFQLQLINELIGSFTISDHHFIYLSFDSLNKGNLITGFYELLYSGHTQILKLTSKKTKEILEANEGVINLIDTHYTYFIKIGNTYTVVKSKNEVIDLLTKHKKEIQHFIKKNKLKFSDDSENSLIMIAGFYDQLEN